MDMNMNVNDVEQVFAAELQTAMVCLGPASEVFSEAVEDAVSKGLTRARCWALVQGVINDTRTARLADLTRAARTGQGISEEIHACRVAGCNKGEIDAALDAGRHAVATVASELALVAV